MRNLVRYPLTLDEIETYLQKTVNDLREKDPIKRPIGSLDIVILETLLFWTKEKQSNK